MFKMFSPQDQVSNFIVTNAYFGETLSSRSNVDESRNVKTTKLSISSTTPSLTAVLTL